MTEEINGLILAGGRSSRMSIDKGLVVYHGKPQREYLFEVLTPFCARVFTSCKNHDHIPRSLNPLPDRFEFESPLNGILSAWQTDSSCAWISAPVDMPMIDKFLIEFLVQNRNRNKPVTCFYDSAGKLPEPLLSIWEPMTKPALEAFYQSGGVSPRDFLMQQDVHIVKAPHPKYLINVNSDADREAFLKSYMKTD
jgi:molybdenum cofactor guanylyltransferase